MFSCHAAIFLDKSRVPEWQVVAAVAGDRDKVSIKQQHDFPNTAAAGAKLRIPD